MHNRRLSVLSALMKKHKAKQLLKEKTDIFSENYKQLFGETFHEDWCSDLKTKQRYQQIFEMKQNHLDQGVKCLFEGALQRQVEEVVGGQRHKRTLLDQHCANTMIRVLTTPYLKIPQLVNAETLKVHPLIRNLFENKAQHALLVGRLKLHLKNSETSTQDGNILSKVQGFKIRFSRTSFPNYKGKLRETIDKFRAAGSYEERRNSSGVTRTRAISEQFILSGQIRWRPQVCNKLRVPKRFHFLSTLQNGGGIFNKGSSSGKQFSNKNRSKRCLFWYSSRHNINERGTYMNSSAYVLTWNKSLWFSLNFYRSSTLLRRIINVKIIIF